MTNLYEHEQWREDLLRTLHLAENAAIREADSRGINPSSEVDWVLMGERFQAAFTILILPLSGDAEEDWGLLRTAERVIRLAQEDAHRLTQTIK